MAVDPIYLNNAYVQTGDGLIYFEGICYERSDMATFSTDYTFGSKVTCTEDWSLWVLGRESGIKKWIEVTA